MINNTWFNSRIIFLSTPSLKTYVSSTFFIEEYTCLLISVAILVPSELRDWSWALNSVDVPKCDILLRV